MWLCLLCFLSTDMSVAQCPVPYPGKITMGEAPRLLQETRCGAEFWITKSRLSCLSEPKSAGQNQVATIYLSARLSQSRVERVLQKQCPFLTQRELSEQVFDSLIHSWISVKEHIWLIFGLNHTWYIECKQGSARKIEMSFWTKQIQCQVLCRPSIR